MRLAFLILISCLCAWLYSAAREQGVEDIHLREISLTETSTGLVGPTGKTVQLPVAIGGSERRALELGFRPIDRAAAGPRKQEALMPEKQKE